MTANVVVQGSLFEQRDDGPLVLSYGIGVDSTAILAAWHKTGVRPDLILFADTGAEHDRTYRYRDMMQRWLASVGFPQITTVRYRPAHGRYETIVEECILKMVLPSLAYGSKSCSQKWKVAPQQRFLATWAPAVTAWSRGARIRNAIGYDAGPKDKQRGKENVDTPLTKFVYPLREWGWDRSRCEEEIASCGTLVRSAADAGIPVSPQHSSCICCPSMRPDELLSMEADEPDSLATALALERIALPHLSKLHGLWRRDTKQQPASWNRFATEHLPDMAPATPEEANRRLRRSRATMPRPPQGERYATRNEAADITYHHGLADALSAAGRGTVSLWIDGGWYDSEESRVG